MPISVPPGTRQNAVLTKAEATMTLNLHQLKLADDAFWAAEDRGADAMAREPVGHFHGLLLDAPARVDLARRNTLPIGIYHHGTLRDLAVTKLPRLGVLTAINPATNRLFLASCAGLDRDDDLLEPPPRDPASLPEGDMSTSYAAELRELLDLPWSPQTLWLTVQYRAVVSNRVAVELVGHGPAQPGSDRAAGALGLPGGRAANLPSMSRLRIEGTPAEQALPPQTGVLLSGSRVVDGRRDDPWWLQVGLRLAPQGRSAVTVHVLRLGANDGSVALAQVLVEATTDAGDGSAIARFSVDLRRMAPAAVAQTYFVTAFTGTEMSAPWIMSVAATAETPWS